MESDRRCVRSVWRRLRKWKESSCTKNWYPHRSTKIDKCKRNITLTACAMRGRTTMTPFHLKAWAKRPDICTTLRASELPYILRTRASLQVGFKSTPPRRAQEFSFWTRTTVLLSPWIEICCDPQRPPFTPQNCPSPSHYWNFCPIIIFLQWLLYHKGVIIVKVRCLVGHSSCN